LINSALREVLFRPNFNTTLRGHEGWVNAVAFSPDGVWLASGSSDGTVRLWPVQTTTDEPVVLRGHEGGVYTVAFSPDGAWLASGGHDGTVRLWSVQTLKTKPVVLRGQADWAQTVAFSPDGSLLASGSSDGTIRLWSVQEPVAEPVVLNSRSSVASVVFSPDGAWLASGSWDRLVRLWRGSLEELARIGCQRVRRNLSLEEWRRYLPADQPYRFTCPIPGQPTLAEVPGITN
jgi:WD40 repeat protein